MSWDEGPLTATLARVSGPSEVAVIRVMEGPSAGTERIVLAEPSTLGSGEQATHRLDDRTVSRLHCELAYRDGLLRVRDLSSKNGTWLRGCRIHSADLASGARFRVGESVLLVATDRREVQRTIYKGGDRFGALVGASDAMQGLFARLELFAPTFATVLILGESGTGKELVARELHRRGPRPDGPFVALNAGALSSSFVDFELFGNEVGAFSGAERERAGAFERASCGTLFLDEIGDLPIELQPKLLRVLEQRVVRRMGAVKDLPVDVRVVAATHRPLAAMVNEGSFREDLYYRLAVMELAVPPLRDRRADVDLLAESFLSRLGVDDAATRADVSEALARNPHRGWPGNVRELENLITRVVVTGDVGAPIATDLTARPEMSYHHAKRDWLERFEREYLPRLLDEAGGNVSEAARRAGLSRSHLTAMLKRLDEP